MNENNSEKYLSDMAEAEKFGVKDRLSKLAKGTLWAFEGEALSDDELELVSAAGSSSSNSSNNANFCCTKCGTVFSINIEASFAVCPNCKTRYTFNG